MLYFEVRSYKVTRGANFSRAAERFDAFVTCRGAPGQELTVFALSEGAPAGSNYSDTRSGRGTCFVSAAQFEWFIDLLRHESPVFARLDSAHPEHNGLLVGPQASGEAETPDLGAWLEAHPRVRDALVWEGARAPWPYRSWDDGMKADLNDAFARACRLLPGRLRDPAPNQITLQGNEEVRTRLSVADARAMYLAHVAQSLAAEINRWVPWSILKDGDDILALLLDSRSFFHWNDGARGFDILFELHGPSLPGDPTFAYRFLVQNGLVGPTRRDTIANLLDWGRSNLKHYYGDTPGASPAEKMQAHWQYRGFAPASRVLSGTTRTGSETSTGHFTNGCHGTAGFLGAVLRTVNIPVTYRKVGYHGTPDFVTEGMTLSHGDDIYTKLVKCTPPFPADELLISQARFRKLLGDHLPMDMRNANVGRRASELAVKHLADWLLWLHCQDKAAGRVPENSLVFLEYIPDVTTPGAFLSRYFSMDELKSERLWERLDAKIDQMGGCGKIKEPAGRNLQPET